MYYCENVYKLFHNFNEKIVGLYFPMLLTHNIKNLDQLETYDVKNDNDENIDIEMNNMILTM